jgi:predicted phage-related endonuclease
MILECEQGTQAWLDARIGKITASRIADVMAFNNPSAVQAKEAGYKLVSEAVAAGIKGPPSAARTSYFWEIVAERLTGLAKENTAAFARRVQWGTEQEPFARAAYEVRTGRMVEQVGFIVHPLMDFTGGSPDALSGTHGVVELKCPDTTTHLQWMAAGIVPGEHEAQCLWNIACCGREWCDFVSFDPRMPDDMQLFVVRLKRDDDRIAQMIEAVVQFETEIVAQIEGLRGKQ